VIAIAMATVPVLAMAIAVAMVVAIVIAIVIATAGGIVTLVCGIQVRSALEQ
jgi:hypothetical protein